MYDLLFQGFNLWVNTSLRADNNQHQVVLYVKLKLVLIETIAQLALPYLTRIQSY